MSAKWSMNFIQNSILLPFFPQFVYRNFSTSRGSFINLNYTIFQQPLFHHKKIYLTVLNSFHFSSFFIFFRFVKVFSLFPFSLLMSAVLFSFDHLLILKCWFWIIQRLIYSTIKMKIDWLDKSPYANVAIAKNNNKEIRCWLMLDYSDNIQ